jgi:hypothetical protein
VPELTAVADGGVDVDERGVTEHHVVADGDSAGVDRTFTVEADPTFSRRFTGHVEDGRDSRTYPGPAIVVG